MRISIRAIALLLMAAVVLGAGSGLEAQKRTGKKRAATTARTSGGALSTAKLKDNTVICYNNAHLDGGLLMRSSITLVPGDIKWDFGYIRYTGSYSVAGNTLSIKSAALSISASSTNGGRTFNGTFRNSKKGISDKCVLYNVTPNPANTPEKIRQMLLEGTYRAAYIELRAQGQPVLAFPVKVTFTPDAEKNNTGEYKVTGDNTVMTALGILKGRYAFMENTLCVVPCGNYNTNILPLNGKAAGYIFFYLKNQVIPGLESGYGGLDIGLSIYY